MAKPAPKKPTFMDMPVLSKMQVVSLEEMAFHFGVLDAVMLCPNNHAGDYTKARLKAAYLNGVDFGEQLAPEYEALRPEMGEIWFSDGLEKPDDGALADAVAGAKQVDDVQPSDAAMAAAVKNVVASVGAAKSAPVPAVVCITNGDADKCEWLKFKLPAPPATA